MHDRVRPQAHDLRRSRNQATYWKQRWLLMSEITSLMMNAVNDLQLLPIPLLPSHF